MDVIIRIITMIKPKKIKRKPPWPLSYLVDLWNFVVGLFTPLFWTLEAFLRVLFFFVNIFERIYGGVIKMFWKVLWGLTLGPFVNLGKKKRRGKKAAPPRIESGRRDYRKKVLKMLKWQ